MYDKKRLLVEKHSQSVSMDVGQKKAYLNGDEVEMCIRDSTYGASVIRIYWV